MAEEIPFIEASGEDPAAFPTLTEAQIEELRPITTPRTFRDGEFLWRMGSVLPSFFILLNGAVDIRQRDATGQPSLLVRHGPRGFTGDIDLLSGKGTVVEAIANGPTEVLEIAPAALKQLVVTNSALSDLIVEAFLSRRRHALARGMGSVLVIGSTYSPDTFRIREFLERNSRPFEGRGVYFGATNMEAQFCQGRQVVVVGGGNSAGQAAVFLARHASKVFILIRGGDLGKSMSRYLVSRIEETDNIELLTHTEVIDVPGEESIEAIRVRNNQSDEETTLDAQHLFVFIGASPNADWLGTCLQRDGKGFILTGRDLDQRRLDPARWIGRQGPYLLETSQPGVFAAGDVRSGSVKRVASAVGEGSICVQFVHQVLSHLAEV